MIEPILRAAAISELRHKLRGRPAPAAAAPALPAGAPSPSAAAATTTAASAPLSVTPPGGLSTAAAGPPPARAPLVAVGRQPERAAAEAVPPAELERLRLDAHQAGYAQGLEEGRAAAQEQGRAAARQQAARLDTLLDALTQQLGRQIGALEDVVLQVALAVSGRLIGEGVRQGDAARHAVREALAQARQDEVLAVRLNPQDLALLAALQEGPAQRRLPWVADEGVAAGGCVVEVAGGRIDARLPTQLERLLQAVADAARGPSEGR